MHTNLKHTRKLEMTTIAITKGKGYKRGCNTNKGMVCVAVCESVCVHDICISGSQAALVLDGPHLYVHTEWAQVLRMAQRSHQKGQELKWS